MSSPKIYGLLGWPVSHSRSPAMQTAAFKALNINAEYRLFAINPDDLDNFLKEILQKNISGLNITVPHKEKVLEFVKFDEKNLFLKEIKAVNTISYRDGSFYAYNTDIEGFSKSLKENFDPLGKSVAVLGAGGAAKAVAFALAQDKANQIVIWARDKNKSQGIVGIVKKFFPTTDIFCVDKINDLNIENKDLLVNTTSVGMKETDDLLIDSSKLSSQTFVFDLIYNPVETKLLQVAAKIGCKTSNGLMMLLYQGEAAFEIWTGQSAPHEVMKNALLEAMKK